MEEGSGGRGGSGDGKKLIGNFRAVLQCFGDVGGSYFFDAGQVGDGAGDLDDFLVRAGGEIHGGGGLGQEFLGVGSQWGVSLELAASELGVTGKPGALEAALLEAAGQLDPGLNGR